MPQVVQFVQYTITQNKYSPKPRMFRLIEAAYKKSNLPHSCFRVIQGTYK